MSTREDHLRHALILALEMIAELRGYTADWDWKYKNAWDDQEREIRQYLDRKESA